MASTAMIHTLNTATRTPLRPKVQILLRRVRLEESKKDTLAADIRDMHRNTVAVDTAEGTAILWEQHRQTAQ
jgi:hypothetical protein